MKSRDTLEKYFRDNLQEIQVAPEPELWLNISSRLNKKEKHRSVFYFWFEKFGNIAASFFVMFSLFHFEKNKSTLDLQKNEVATTVTKPSSVSTNSSITTVRQRHNARTGNVDKQYGDNEAEEGILSIQKTSHKTLTSSDKEVSIAQKEKKTIIKTENIPNNEDTSLAFFSLTKSSFKNYTNTIIAKPITLAQLESLNPLSVLAASEEREKEKEKKNKKEKIKSDKWMISLNAIPNLIANNSKSSISSDFENNSDTNTRINYGISLGYKVNKKINLRTGLNKTNTVDKVNNVSYLFSPANTSLASNIETLQLHSSEGNLILGNNAQSYIETINPLTTTNEGTINLNLSYFEIPIEILYNITASKNFNLNTITGLSTFVLDINQAQLKTSNNEVIAIGKSTNVNEQYFAINIGLGMNHKVFKNLYFQFEPIIKYHMNPFKKDNKNYNPTTINFSTGICYRF